MKNLRRIVLATALCMVIGLQGMIPVSAAEKGTAGVMAIICPWCGGRTNVSETTETTCTVYTCTNKSHVNCNVHETTVTTYRVYTCPDCGDVSRDIIKSDTTYNHLIG